MKRKELKNLAKKIADLQAILNKGECTKEEKQQIESEIMILCGKVNNFEEMIIVDDLILEYLKN